MCKTLLTLQEVLDGVKGSLIGDSFKSSDFVFTSVATDSRNVTQNSLFVPLIGEFQDGHSYIPKALEAGASVIFAAASSVEAGVLDYSGLAKANPSVAFIKVENTLTALQNAAEKYVSKFPELIRVSVTGSSGKTTTKEIAASILSQKFNVICNKGNLNSETGLPLSCFEIRSEHNLALLEMGMNRENEIGEIAKVFKPDFAAITNVGTAHIGMLGSRDKIAEEKKKVFNYVKESGVCVIPAADDYAEFLSENVKGKVVYYGNDVKNNGIEFISDDGIDGTTFAVDGVKVHLAIPGKYNYSNTLAGVELGRALGLTPQEIKAGIEAVKPLSGRSHIRKGKYIILEDCYNANPDSMEKALEFANSITLPGKKIYIIGDMKELGEESASAHEKIAELAVEGDASLIVFVGNEIKAGYIKAAGVVASQNKNVRLLHYENYKDEDIKKISEEVKEYVEKGDFILLKASHSVSLERLIPLFEGDGCE